MTRKKPWTNRPALKGKGLNRENRAHFKCWLCSSPVWREGGHGIAKKHTLYSHGPGVTGDYDLEIRKAQVFLGRVSNGGASIGNTCQRKHNYLDTEVIEGQCPKCYADEQVMQVIKKVR